MRLSIGLYVNDPDLFCSFLGWHYEVALRVFMLSFTATSNRGPQTPFCLRIPAGDRSQTSKQF